MPSIQLLCIFQIFFTNKARYNKKRSKGYFLFCVQAYTSIFARWIYTLIPNSSPCSSSIRPLLWSKCVLAIGKPHSVILHQLPGLGIRLRGLQITQGEFIDSMFMLHRHDGTIGLIQEGDGQNADPSALTNRPALIFFHGGGKRQDQVLFQVGMPAPKRRELVVTLCPVHDRLNPLALFSPEIEPARLGLKLRDGRSHIVLGVTCCCRFHFIERQIHF